MGESRLTVRRSSLVLLDLRRAYREYDFGMTTSAPARPPLSVVALMGFMLGIGAALGTIAALLGFFGAFGIVPIVVGLAGFIVSIVGVSDTRDGVKSGRGFALAGLIIGILGLIGLVVGTVLFSRS